MSLIDDLKINALELDVEWASLPTLIQSYSFESDRLEAEIKTLKLRLDRVDAEQDLNIRRNPGKFNIEGKPTETMIKSIIATNVARQVIAKEIIQRELERRLLFSAVRSLDAKKDSLKALTTLYASEYYSQPADKKTMSRFNKKQNAAAKTDAKKSVLAALNKKRKNKKSEK